MLKGTGRTPEDTPAWMNAKTALSMKRCEQARGPGYAARIRPRFPNGIVGANGPLRMFGYGRVQQR